MSKTLRFIIATLVTITVAGFAAPAIAAPIANVGWKSVDVTLHTEESQSMLLVSGDLPDDAKLPFETELAVPAGAELSWVGEILGGAIDQDPELKYTKSTVGGMDVYRFTLTKSRTAQIEAVVPNVITSDGTTYSSGLKWTAWRALPEVIISQRIAQGAVIGQAAPGATVQPDESGSQYVSKSVPDVKAGDVVDLVFTYTIPVATAPAGYASAGSNTGAVVAIVALFLGTLLLVGIGLARKMASRADVTSDDEDEDFGDDDAVTPVLAAGVDSPADDEEPTPAKKVKPAFVVLAVVGVLILGVVVAVNFAASTPVVGNKMTKFFGAASPCTSVLLPVAAAEGVDLAKQGMTLINAFTGQENIGNVTLDLAASTVFVDFCESSHNEESIRQTLLGTGLVTVGAALPAAAPATGTPAP